MMLNFSMDCQCEIYMRINIIRRRNSDEILFFTAGDTNGVIFGAVIGSVLGLIFIVAIALLVCYALKNRYEHVILYSE